MQLHTFQDIGSTLSCTSSQSLVPVCLPAKEAVEDFNMDFLTQAGPLGGSLKIWIFPKEQRGWGSSPAGCFLQPHKTEDP